ncbi:MAG: ABC-F family ATP-binding cassette domain-containing protein [Bacteroidales bacterium]|jgi:ATP-binding cassette subfamily F protein 3|nr:ABC-F family ATP-binding cassette domain-containing protein [Bacteroidales bacterium]
MISVNNLSVQFSGKDLFKGISFIIADNDRIGLAGKNGAGKSTLLKILAKQMQPESGTIVVTSGHTIGYLPQEIIPHSTRTVIDEALTAFEEAAYLEKNIERLTLEMSERTDYESEDYSRLMIALHDANERYHIIGAANKQAETEKVLLGLGFKHSDFSRKITEFSSGWQMRVELAKILLQRPNVMLLDEPTNHLDIESIQWLETFLQNYEGAVVLVSHDRAFLDAVTKRTIEIVLGKIEDYKASYSEYVIQREERRRTQVNAYNNQQKEIADMERFVERFRAKATKARQAQSRIKLLDKMERIEIDEIDTSVMHFKFPTSPHSGKVVVEVENVVKKYGENLVLDGVTLMLERGEKIAFVGKNGEGKSTLSKIIMDEIPFDGLARLGHQVQVGYFAQNQAALLDGEKTVFQTIDDIAVGEIRPRIRNILGSFLFGSEDIDKKVKVLSGGEKMRLALAKLLLTPVNLLILDEPTNHLDMRSKDVLKMALLKYDGAMIIVSHDRDFLQGLTDKVYEFKDKKIKMHIGDIYEFLESRNIENLNDLNRNPIVRAGADLQSVPTKTSSNEQDRQKKKDQEREQRRRQNQIEKLETEIELLEQKKIEMDELLSNPTNITNSQIFIDYNKLKEKIDKAMNEWEKLSE